MARKRLRTRSLPLAELRRLVPAMHEHLVHCAQEARLQPHGRVWFDRLGRISSCEVREKGSDFCLLIRHTIRFR